MGKTTFASGLGKGGLCLLPVHVWAGGRVHSKSFLRAGMLSMRVNR